MEQDPGFIAAVEEAKQGLSEGGVPIGAALVSKDGKILGRGHNMRVQKGSAVLHVSTAWYTPIDINCRSISISTIIAFMNYR